MSKILSDVEAFCATHNITVSELGKAAINDPALVGNMRKGRRLWPETESKVRAFMEQHKLDRPTT